MNTVKLNKNRKDMAMLFTGIGVEVGVADGKYAEYILSHNTAVTKLFGVDIYKPHEGYRDYVHGSTFRRMQQLAIERVAPYGDRHQFLTMFSMEAVKHFNPEDLDFVYIDANHDYKHAKEDIIEWSKKVKSGGIVCGDDYSRRRDPDMRYDVINAVNDYVKENNIPELILYVEGKGPTNWLFIKP